MHVMAHGFSKFLSSPFRPIPVSSYTAGQEQQHHQNGDTASMSSLL